MKTASDWTIDKNFGALLRGSYDAKIGFIRAIQADAQPTAGWMPICHLTDCPHCSRDIACKYDGKTLTVTKENI